MGVDELDIRKHLKKCIEFDYSNLNEYISEMAHRVKYFGEVGFIEEYSKEEDIEYSKKYSIAHTCFLIGLIEYLCNKNNVVIPLVICKHKNIKLNFILFHPGDIIIYKETGDIDELYESYNEALVEFLNHNIVLGKDIFDII